MKMIVIMIMIASYTNDHDRIVHGWWLSSLSWSHRARMMMIILYMDNDRSLWSKKSGSYLQTGSPERPFRSLDIDNKKMIRPLTNIPTTLILSTRVNGIVMWNEIMLWIFNFVVCCHICMWFAPTPSHLVWVHIWKPLSSAFIQILKCVVSSALYGKLSRARLSP